MWPRGRRFTRVVGSYLVRTMIFSSKRVGGDAQGTMKAQYSIFHSLATLACLRRGGADCQRSAAGDVWEQVKLVRCAASQIVVIPLLWLDGFAVFVSRFCSPDLRLPAATPPQRVTSLRKRLL